MYSTSLPSINAGYAAYDKTYRTAYPPPPSYSNSCVINVDYDTLPVGQCMRKTILGPTSLKQLYIAPDYYPPQAMDVPENTLYGPNDGSVFTFVGNRRTYGKKIYPFTQRSPREVNVFTGSILPVPAVQGWTEYPVLSDGAWGR